MLRCERARRRGAFSLVELIVVIVILSMLAGLVAFKTRSYLITSKQNSAKVEIRKLCEALETFFAMNDRYPSSDEGLEILATGNERMPNGIIDKVPLDPWRYPYQYNMPGKSGAYDVICLGADGREGGANSDSDISNHDIESAQQK
ncbi:MAG: type II secretion system major pseudopilin GspG [Planctomycetota bacterium]